MSNREKPDSVSRRPIMKMILPQYIRWHQELMINLRNLWGNGTGLEEIIAASGYHFPQKSAHGLLVVPLEEDRVRSGVMRALSRENQSYSFRVALHLAGLLKMDEAIPQILDALRENRCDDRDQIHAFKSLMMLEYDSKKLAKLMKEYASANSEDAFSVLLVRSLVLSGTSTAAKQAFKLIKSLDEDQRVRALPYLKTIHKHGIDTSVLLDFLVEDETDYYADTKVEWARFLGTRDVLERVLDSRKKILVRMMLCQCLAAPEQWEMVYPLLLDRKDRWLHDDDDIETSVRLAFMAALGRFGHDLSSYRDAENWVVRCGAWLAAATSDETIDADQELASENDGEVRYAIELVRTLHLDRVFPFQEQRLIRRYLGVGYGLGPITLALVAGFGREDMLPALKREHDRATTRDTTRLCEDIEDGDEELLLDVFRKTKDEWINFPDRMFFRIPLRVFNGMILSLIHPNREFGFFLSEMFLKNLDFDESGTLFLLMALRDDVPDSVIRRAKELLHATTSDHLNLTTNEFDVLYPYVFQGDRKYASLIVSSAGSVLRAEPRTALHIIRLVPLDPSVNERVMDLIADTDEEPLAHDLARVSRGELPDFARASSLDLYGESEAVQRARLQELRADRLPEARAVSELIELLNIDDEEYFEMVLEEIQRHVNDEELNSIIQTGMGRGWTIRRACARFMAHNPRENYLFLAFTLLKDDDRDVGKVAADACSAILDKCMPDHRLIRFVDTEWSDDEKLASGIKSIESRIQRPNAFEEHLGESCIVVPFDGGSRSGAEALPPGAIPQQDALDLLLHLVVDFVDKNTNRLVAHVAEQKTGEVVNWLLEQGYCTYFSVHKA